MGDFILRLFSQFAGGPGPPENNLVRFGLAAVLYAALFLVAWSRQRQQEYPREKLLLWGFGLGLTRETYKFLHTAIRMLTGTDHDAFCTVSEPVEHTLAMAAIIVVAGAFIRYLLDDEKLARRYLRIGLGATALSYLSTFWWWAQQLAANPELKFHQVWVAWVFHVVAAILMAAAIIILARSKGWLRNVITLALFLFFLGEVIILFNYGTDRAYNQIICPLGNGFHILAIPLLGYVYLREQADEKKRAEDELAAYRLQLEELVEARTAELTTANEQLQQEILERTQAQKALAALSRQNELILELGRRGDHRHRPARAAHLCQPGRGTDVGL